jgi:hypothetical protein
MISARNYPTPSVERSNVRIGAPGANSKFAKFLAMQDLDLPKKYQSFTRVEPKAFGVQPLILAYRLYIQPAQVRH